MAIDLFSGAGGLSLGIEMAGFDVVSAVEYDPVHAATHLYNFPLTDTLCRDISRLTGADLIESAGRGWKLHNPEGADWDGIVDLIVGGPSCQGFSSIGYRDADDERNKLVGEFVRIVEEVRPRAFIMENVPGILSGQYAGLLEHALKRLRRAGYLIADHSTPLDASNFGVPQKRKRVVFAGTLSTVMPPALPTPTHSTPVTVGEAFAGLPSVRGRTGSNGDSFVMDNDQLAEYRDSWNDYLKLLHSGAQSDRAEHRNQVVTSLSGYRITEHRPTSVARFAEVPEGGVEPVSRAWRLNRASPARTLRAGTGRERGAFSASRPLHPTEPRVITIREAARLHSFPDWFHFHSTNWHGHRQIGNAVPPLLAKAIGKSVLDALAIETQLPLSPVRIGGNESLLTMNPTSAAAYFKAVAEEVPKARQRPAVQVQTQAVLNIA